MKRRDFLKYIGLAVACPLQLLKSKEKKHKGGIVHGHGVSLLFDGIELKEGKYGLSLDEPTYRAEPFLCNLDTIEIELTFPSGIFVGKLD